ncbi:hypothetical protein ABFY59_28610 [Priestia aryabhattai]|uniref:hypothetical protein n=1 Tax=Priestia aryabhattai TaxID=412384 RepID=UPI003D2A80A8
MAFSQQLNFLGTLDGTDVNKINKKIDYRKTKLEERKQIVENILNNTEFYTEYFSGFFKTNLNSKDPLSSGVNVCKSLERMVDYLLSSDEIKREKDTEKAQYAFHTNTYYFQKKIDREQSIEALSETQGSGRSEFILHLLQEGERHYKKEKKQVISKKDLAHDGLLGEILRDYNTYEEFITNELKRKEKSNFNRYNLTKIKGQIFHDMIYIKNYFLGAFDFDLKTFAESTDYATDVFDFTNELHLKGGVIETESGTTLVAKGLLFFRPSHDLNSNFNHTLWDLQNTIDSAKLTNFEKIVLESYRNGLTQEEIALQLNTYQKKISRTISTIARKIIKMGNKYDLAG